jgi:hypothetical protein
MWLPPTQGNTRQCSERKEHQNVIPFSSIRQDAADSRPEIIIAAAFVHRRRLVRSIFSASIV